MIQSLKDELLLQTWKELLACPVETEKEKEKDLPGKRERYWNI